MKVLAIIPARYGSSRFPGKPLVNIQGKPMIQRVYERTREVFTDCYVATDHQDIYDKCLSFGASVVMTSTAHNSGTDRCCEAMNNIGGHWDVIVNIQGDEPFIATSQLKAIIALFDDNKTQIGTLISPFEATDDIENPNTPKVVVTTNGFALYFSRSVIPYVRDCDTELWTSKQQYYKHVGLYAYRSEVLKEITSLPQSSLELSESLEQLRWLENGYSIKIAITNEKTYSIDTPEDLKLLEKLF